MKFRILVFTVLFFTFLTAGKVDIAQVSSTTVSNEPSGYIGANLPTTPELSAMRNNFKAAVGPGRFQNRQEN